MTEQPGMSRQRNLGDSLADAHRIPDDQLPLAQVTAAADRLYGAINFDSKTGLHNGNAFVAAVHDMIPHVPEGHTLRVAMYDLDGFKAVNDALGHPAGDAVLRETGQVMAADYAREGEIVAHGSRDTTAKVARLSGDEFAAAYIVPLNDEFGEGYRRQASQAVAHLPEHAQPLPVDPQTERVISDWHDRFELTEFGRFNVGLTAGVADLAPGDTVETLLAKADSALNINKYAAKTQGIVDRSEAAEDLTDLVTTYTTLQANGLRVPEVLPYAIRQVADKMGADLPPELGL
jgi:GGDEF domain-containing protein